MSVYQSRNAFKWTKPISSSLLLINSIEITKTIFLTIASFCFLVFSIMSTLRSCRGCGKTGGDLFLLNSTFDGDRKYKEAYEFLLGKPLNPDFNLSRKLCGLCRSKLEVIANTITNWRAFEASLGREEQVNVPSTSTNVVAVKSEPTVEEYKAPVVLVKNPFWPLTHSLLNLFRAMLKLRLASFTARKFQTLDSEKQPRR